MNFLDFCVKYRHQSNSQHLQDLFALYEIGFGRAVFIEMGAFDGVTFSNSLMLEHIGWSGLLVEPNSRYHESILQKRRTKLDKRCVFHTSGMKLEFMDCDIIGGLACLDPDDMHVARRLASGRIYVDTVSFSDLIEQNNLPSVIDFFSLDVEGAELDILKSINFDKFNIRCLVVEHNHSHQRDKIYQFLTSLGYVRKFEKYSLHDDWYVSPHHIGYDWGNFNFPNDPISTISTVSHYIGGASWPMTLKLAREAVELNPESILARKNLIGCLITCGDFDLAFDEISSCFKSYGSNPDILELLNLLIQKLTLK